MSRPWTNVQLPGGKPEITRFKGLDEISPKELAQSIGKEMRLSKVEYAPRAESGPIFDFYMGKGTPACVAEAAIANQAAQRRQPPAPQPVAYASARQRPERKDYIMEKLVVPVEE